MVAVFLRSAASFGTYYCGGPPIDIILLGISIKIDGAKFSEQKRSGLDAHKDTPDSSTGEAMAGALTSIPCGKMLGPSVAGSHTEQLHPIGLRKVIDCGQCIG